VDPNGYLVAFNSKTREYVRLSNRYGLSTHNCECNRSKTGMNICKKNFARNWLFHYLTKGIVYYPEDIRHKNIVLLVCEQCYGYKSEAGKGSQHTQLDEWYYKIYGTSKQFTLKSGFSQKRDGTLGFNSWTFNNDPQYGTGVRTMEKLEQDVIRKVITEKLNNYDICCGKMHAVAWSHPNSVWTQLPSKIHTLQKKIELYFNQ